MGEMKILQRLENKASTLEIVEDHLKGRDDIVIVKTSRTLSPVYKGRQSESVVFCIAPIKEGIYDVDRLQSLMLELIPEGVKPASQSNFGEYGNRIILGVVFFDENVKPADVNETELQRTIRINVYPDRKSAKSEKCIYDLKKPSLVDELKKLVLR